MYSDGHSQFGAERVNGPSAGPSRNREVSPVGANYGYMAKYNGEDSLSAHRFPVLETCSFRRQPVKRGDGPLPRTELNVHEPPLP